MAGFASVGQIAVGRTTGEPSTRGHCGRHVHTQAAPPGRRQDPRPYHRAILSGTQQPLGGKAQFGGQRLGEMEVWAMEATVQLTRCRNSSRSSRMTSRAVLACTRAIVKGEHVLEPGLPESFNVLVKELQSLVPQCRTDRRPTQIAIKTEALLGTSRPRCAGQRSCREGRRR